VLPLLSRGEWMGAITLAVTRRRRYSWDDLRVFEQLADRLALALDNARLHRDNRRLAGVLQQSLLPLELPQLSGLEAAASFHAGSGYEFGGVFYDAWTVAGGMMVVVGDVGGRGAEIAGVLAQAGRALRTAGAHEADPVHLLERLNAMLVPCGLPYCTVAVARIAGSHHGAELTVACAGHYPPLVRRGRGGLRAVAASGRPLGVARDLELRPGRLRLDPADTLVLASDTVVSEQRGHDALRARLLVARDAGAQELADGIVASVAEAHRDSADAQLAVLVIRVDSATR
jgi:serine phosphatase RsbU (regulator of sigma subunit)